MVLGRGRGNDDRVQREAGEHGWGKSRREEGSGGGGGGSGGDDGVGGSGGGGKGGEQDGE